jgi:hypothetical protein
MHTYVLMYVVLTALINLSITVVSVQDPFSTSSVHFVAEELYYRA